MRQAGGVVTALALAFTPLQGAGACEAWVLTPVSEIKVEEVQRGGLPDMAFCQGDPDYSCRCKLRAVVDKKYWRPLLVKVGEGDDVMFFLGSGSSFVPGETSAQLLWIDSCPAGTLLAFQEEMRGQDRFWAAVQPPQPATQVFRFGKATRF